LSLVNARKKKGGKTERLLKLGESTNSTKKGRSKTRQKPKKQVGTATSSLSGGGGKEGSLKWRKKVCGGCYLNVGIKIRNQGGGKKKPSANFLLFCFGGKWMSWIDQQDDLGDTNHTAPGGTTM